MRLGAGATFQPESLPQVFRVAVVGGHALEIAQLENMVTTALQEAEIEGLIISKGYADCVAYMSDGAISVAVAAPEEGLEADAVAQICDIVTTQSDYTPSELKIIEVK